MKLLGRIWDSKWMLAALVVAYAAIEFYGYADDMDEARGRRVQNEVSAEVGAKLRAQSEARQAKLMEDLKALAPTPPTSPPP